MHEHHEVAAGCRVCNSTLLIIIIITIIILNNRVSFRGRGAGGGALRIATNHICNIRSLNDESVQICTFLLLFKVPFNCVGVSVRNG